MSMTGTSLHDLPKRRVGNEMCDRARNPNGAADDATKAMKAYRRNSRDALCPVRALSTPFMECTPFAVPFPLAAFVLFRPSLSLRPTGCGSPKTSRQDTPGLRLVRTR